MASGPRQRLFVQEFESLVAGHTRLQLLRSGLSLGLFEALREPLRQGELAERLALDPDLLAAWLRTAHAHGLVVRSHHPRDAYRAAALPRWLLDAPDAGPRRALLDQAVLAWGPSFDRLPELLRGAPRPRFGAGDEAVRTALVARLVERRALAALRRVPGARDARTVLDIGCGYATYLAGLLQHWRDASGLGVEIDPAVAERAREVLVEARVSRRAEVRVGDFMTLDLPRRTFDLVLLNNNLHYFPPERRRALFERVRARLAPKGVFAIQTAVATRDLRARLSGMTRRTTAFDLYLRCHANLYGLPDVSPLRETLEAVGFARVGETPVVRGGSQRYVWARAAAA